MKDRFLYNKENDTVHDTLQEIDLINKEIVNMLNNYNEENFELESDFRYYKGLYNMYEGNYLRIKEEVETLLLKYRDLSVVDKDFKDNYVMFIADLEALF